MIYLDHNATTPVDPRVLESMLPFFREEFANASSRQHRAGRRAGQAVETAREKVASVLAADPREITFTSGATEANNLAILGASAARAYRRKRHVVTVATEHKAVLDPCEQLARRGYRVTVLPVDRDGLLDPDELEGALDDETLLVSVMAANNETGVLQPIEEVGRLCRQEKVLFHTDATQAVGRIPLDVDEIGIDLLSLSAHKVYGPKGVGALYVRRKGPRARCEPLIHGGGHERGLRSGTLNVPGIVGLGEAVEIASESMGRERARLEELRDRLERGLREGWPGTIVHGSGARRLANTLNVSFPGVDAEALIADLPDLAVSSSAACTTSSRLPSYVLGAMGFPDEIARSSIRFSLGRGTTAGDIDRALAWVLAELPAPAREPPRGRERSPDRS